MNGEDGIVLRNSERQPCEVWTRVMGYHRPVESFNIGKKGEHAERIFFREDRAGLGEVEAEPGGEYEVPPDSVPGPGGAEDEDSDQ